MSAFWTLDRVADALDGSVLGARPRGRRALRAVATDTRTIGTDDVFVALVGERFDAHDFLAEAVSKGACAAIVSRPIPLGTVRVPLYEVDDTLVALGRLARYRRRAWGKPIVAVTGSNGKTSTKELLRGALAPAGTVHATSGNFNNRVGVPLTLFALPDEAELAVLELGTNVPGEVGMLTAIVEPELAVITSVAEEHLEGLGDLDGVLREETAVCGPGRVVITPASQPEIGAAARAAGSRVVEAGLDEGALRATRWGVDGDGRGWLEIDGVTVRPPLRGAHNLRNAMLALAAAREVGIPLDAAARGIERATQPAMRTAWETLGRATLINDAYNANPGSTRAALDLLAGTGDGRQRVAVLGTMRELGPQAPRLHEEIARLALDARLDLVAGIGEFADALRAVGSGDSRVIVAPDVDELWSLLEPRLDRDAVILLKASRGVRLERIVPHLTAWASR